MSNALDLQRIAASKVPPDVYRELATGSDRIRKARNLVAELPEGSSILDVGCSDGALLAPFVGRLQVHGVDGVESLVKAACANGLLARFGDVEELPYADGTFDAIFAGEIVEHLVSPDRFLAGCNRVLKPNGVGIFTIPNIRTPVGMAMLLYGIPPMYAARYRSSHLRDFTAKLVRAALKNNGFEIVRFGGSSFMIPPIGPRFSWLANLFPSWADHFIIKAIKVREASYSPENDFEQYAGY